MGRYRLNILIILSVVAGLIAVMLPGCREAAYSGELTELDSLLGVNPDSARLRLEAYDSLRLRNDNDRHYYALLCAEANDKTYRVLKCQ